MSETTPEYFLGQIAKANGEAKSFRIKARTFREERDAHATKLANLQKLVDGLTADRDALRTRLESAPSDLQKRVDELTGEIRTRDHRAAFERVAIESRVRPEAVDDLWKLSGYAADSDTVDLERIKGLVGEAVTARPYLVQTAADAATPPPARPGPGASRGALDKTPAGLIVTREQMMNPQWCMANKTLVAQATKAGNLTIQD